MIHDERPEEEKRRDQTLAKKLAQLAEERGAESIDEIWVFPTRSIGETQSTVVVLSIFDDDDRRRIMTAQLATRANANHWNTAEHGTTPADRIERLIQGVVRRLDEEIDSAPPQSTRVNGKIQRWKDFLQKLNEPGKTTTHTTPDPA